MTSTASIVLVFRATLIEAGQIVRVAGSPSTRRTALLATNVLLADGREVLTHMTGEPRWSENIIGNSAAVRGTADEYIAPIDDIFRAWTTVHSNTPAYSANPPLTNEARAVLDAFDPLVDDPVVRCVSPGMPEAMTYIGPHPVGFVQLASGDIEVRIESDDNVPNNSYERGRNCRGTTALAPRLLNRTLGGRHLDRHNNEVELAMVQSLRNRRGTAE